MKKSRTNRLFFGKIFNMEPIVNTPQFPGFRKGLDKTAVQNFIKEQVRRKGYRFSGGITPQKFRIDISGNARFLYGIAFLNPSFGVCSLNINNEVVFEQCDTGFFQLGLTNQDYYAINRPLSGQDDITMEITGDLAYNNQPFIVYYK